jgi:glycerol-3-phosphate dehydrogenase
MTSANRAPAAAIDCDLLVIGGGINGVGVARDAAGRGLRVVLCEKDDLAQHTSSASTKLVHGGLRYLEFYEFGLVKKSLAERETLLRTAPFLVTPLRFAMPHAPGARPAWMIRAGLFLYDHLARRQILPGSTMVRLAGTPLAQPLEDRFRRAFLYSDAWVDDARLVVLNAVDAAERGATVLTRTACTSAVAEGGRWRATLAPAGGAPLEVTARAIVNAAGPFASAVAHDVLGQAHAPRLRLVKGSHIVVRRLFDHDTAYLFQNQDGRISFAIPYQDAFTLIGTTDVEHPGDPDHVRIDADEVRYLCEATNRYFRRKIGPADVVWSYSGVRPLLDEADVANPSKLTRDYRLDLALAPAPLLDVWGGKLTTYRRLAEEVLEKLDPALGVAARPWTAGAPLPGGDLDAPGRPVARYEPAAALARLRARWPFLPGPLALRLFRAYGSRADRILDGARSLADLGEPILPGLHPAELRYLVEQEWARTAEDVLWRRSKLGLHASAEEVARLGEWLAGNAGASTSRPGPAGERGLSPAPATRRARET